MVVALGLAALMTAVSSAARSSGSLRDKTLAQWIALNRIAEVRLTVNRIAPTNDTAQLEFGNRTWHYDTRYFDTSVPTMKRIIVRVWAGDSKSTGNPVAEATGFIGQALAQPGGSNAADWTTGSTFNPNGQTNVPGAPTVPTPIPGTAVLPGTGTGSGQSSPP
jgi:general secretion pathway protein I